MTEQIEKAVLAFVAEETGHRLDKLALSDDLCRDLGVAGDDGLSLIVGFSRRFNVDVSGVPVQAVFGDERPLLFLGLMRAIFRVREEDEISISIADLVNAAKRGKLLASSWLVP